MCDEEGDSRKYSLSDNSSFQSVPDADREMAAQAFHEFEKQKYDECLSVLKKLLSKRPQDVKVLHNCAVVEYFLSGSLSLGEVLLAHEYAKTLLSQPRISAAHKFLAHQYAGEALLIMDRITEAVEHLNFQCANEIELAFPVSSSEVSLKHQMRFDSKLNEKNDDGSRPVGNIPNWLPTTISSAKFVTQYNLAVAYACREEWNKAMECLNQMNPNGSVPVEALSLLIYVESHASVNDIKSTIQKYVHPGTA
ncbi:CCR4-NOT transcription complex subunit 10-B like protein [Argiope bruennichi]|uniref:CCR4-NOT transcription complex subunit 10 n=1 Tax=Argiope bruennichi TaxID=94029 RepID=A0A8T0DZT7_ARGBR|nr:CCR4-NOT transcription complex subunit 10-B like protein [Argiope bruennichi]